MVVSLLAIVLQWMNKMRTRGEENVENFPSWSGWLTDKDKQSVLHSRFGFLRGWKGRVIEREREFYGNKKAYTDHWTTNSD